MAQSPMESTTGDFWKMTVERECRVVVMLCGLEEDENVHLSCALIVSFSFITGGVSSVLA